MIAGIKLFETVATHPILILLLTMEVSIFTFFIFLYSFALNRYILFVYWPITVSKECRRAVASHLLKAPGKRQPPLLVLRVGSWVREPKPDRKCSPKT